MSAKHQLVAIAPLALDEDTDWRAAIAAAAQAADQANETLDVVVLGDEAPADLDRAKARLWRAAVPGGLSTSQLAPLAVAALSQIAAQAPGRPLLVVCPAGAGQALAAAIAALGGYQVLGQCSDLALSDDGVVAERIRGGVRLRLACAAPAVIGLQPRGDAVIAQGQAPVVSTLLAVEAGSQDALTVARSPLPGRRARLEAASLVVSGGRGVSQEGFGLLEAIADQLGGALGASLAAIDLGLAPVSRQVGQSGKFVAPDLYLAVGLSGTPQHMAGVAARSRVFAINNDPDAPIFQIAELGLVADWREALPALRRALEGQPS